MSSVIKIRTELISGKHSNYGNNEGCEQLTKGDVEPPSPDICMHINENEGFIYLKLATLSLNLFSKAFA